jgi:hypothetical protein
MKMKNYISPDIEIVTVTACDIITTSVEPDVETPEVDLGYGQFAW